MNILGIWDGHDAGAAILQDNEIKAAINEERLSRRKQEIGFPYLSIKACLDYVNLKPNDIELVSICTSDPAKTLTRAFPALQERYYLLRRRRIAQPRLLNIRRNFKYRYTELKSNGLSKELSRIIIKRKLQKLGFNNYKLKIIDHHLAHAAGAAYTSGFKKSLVITLDGVGDGLSGSVNILEDDELKRISSISAKDSLGIFFEQVTTLLNMRELEDEGKVMALANYAYPIPDEKNKLLNFFRVDGLNISSEYNVTRQFSLLKKILWNNKVEDFAYMAQRTLEENMFVLFNNAIEYTGQKDVCWSGGVASNIKANMMVRELCKRWHIFPHMGDGGLALGAALQSASDESGLRSRQMKDAYFGLDYSDEQIEDTLDNFKSAIKFCKINEISKVAADLIAKNKIVFWFQGRMEYGPRALGNRSIIASPFSEDVKNKLNQRIKQREWFQPFCPSLLEEDANKYFKDTGVADKFMVMGFKVKDEMARKIRSVVHIDGSARPQMVYDENQKFRELIKEHRKDTGDGIVLNTSLNIHGSPIVNTPKEAINLLLRTKEAYLCIGDYICELKDA